MCKKLILLALLPLVATACAQNRKSSPPQLPTGTAGAEPPDEETTAIAGGEVIASLPTATEVTATVPAATATATPTVYPTATIATNTPSPTVTFTPAPPAATPQPAATPPPWTATPPPPTPTAECPAAWFMEHPPDACPAGPSLSSAGASQRFERGQMIWVEQTDTFYILFNAGAYPGDGRLVFVTLAGPLVLTAGGSPDNRVGEDPPPSLHQPVSGFGLLWRGEVEGLAVDLRQALGWAVEKEFGFQSQLQCERPETYSDNTCYLLAADGSVIVLGYHAIAGNVWWRWVGVDG
ncbi:MAG: hypothetical protein GX579_07265 [Chloroflexi bacterium]|nr:hypothetical protein [Chloroflexota bacterium]